MELKKLKCCFEMIYDYKVYIIIIINVRLWCDFNFKGVFFI